MQIQASSIYDQSTVQAAVRMLMGKRFELKKQMVIFGIVYAVLTVVILLELVLLGPDPLLFVMLGLLILIVALLCFYYFGLPKLQYKALAKMQNIVNHFTFSEDAFHVESHGDHYDGTAEIRYEALCKVMESSRYILLFQAKNQFFIVDKTTITGGTAIELRDKLTPILKQKYIVCRY